MLVVPWLMLELNLGDMPRLKGDHLTQWAEERDGEQWLLVLWVCIVG